jgi:hypothetical protein
MPAQLQALNCPNCAAPLQVEASQSLTVCLYCNASVRITYPAGHAPQPAADPTIPPDTIEQIKQLLLAGRQPEALLLYREKSGASEAEAAQAIRNLGQQITAHIVTGQQLSYFGLLLVGLALLALLAGLITAVTGALPPVAAIAMIIPGLFILLIYGRALLASLRYVRAQTAPAAVLRLAPIGQFTGRGGTVHTFRLLLEVRPANAPPFQAQMSLPVRAGSLAKLHENTIIEVKYLPQDPNSVIFNRVISH